jgi:His-Xaa-Ser system protein HxsD
MTEMRFNKELYSKIALIKAAYNFTDVAYIHLDSDEMYYYVTIEEKKGQKTVAEGEFVNEMLAQSVRHEVYLQTKNIRELLLARAMATSVVITDDVDELDSKDTYNENEILKDWFESNA